MNIHEAKQATVDWLRAGGVPNDTIPFNYSYLAATIWPDLNICCAGAAIAHLTGLPGAGTAGEVFFGDFDTFLFRMAVNFSETDPVQMANYVEKLEIKEHRR